MEQQGNSLEEVTQQAVTIAESLYGVVPRIHLFKSWRSHVFRLDFSDGRESNVLKIAKVRNEGDVLREQQILPVLHRRGFEVPHIEHTQETTDFGVPYTLMSFVEGSGMENVGSMAPAIAQATYEHLGHFMARLSVLDAQTIPGGRTSTNVYDYLEYNRREYGKVLRCHPRYTPRLEELFERGFALQHEKTGFVNWDGPQIVTDGADSFAVIDWGIAGVGHPLFDLGMFLMWHGFAVPQIKGLPLHPEWRAWVLRGYLGGRPLTETMRLQIHLLGMSFSIREAMAIYQNDPAKADAFLTFIEAEDTAFQGE